MITPKQKGKITKLASDIHAILLKGDEETLEARDLLMKFINKVHED